MKLRDVCVKYSAIVSRFMFNKSQFRINDPHLYEILLITIFGLFLLFACSCEYIPDRLLRENFSIVNHNTLCGEKIGKRGIKTRVLD